MVVENEDHSQGRHLFIQQLLIEHLLWLDPLLNPGAFTVNTAKYRVLMEFTLYGEEAGQ